LDGIGVYNMEIDITVIIAALGALIGLAASVAKLYSKGKAVIAAAKDFLEAIKQLFIELKKANDDGKITQEEYDLLMKEANDIIKKGQKAIKKGEDFLHDLDALKTQILQIVASRTVNGDVEDAIKESEPPVPDKDEKKDDEEHALGDIQDKEEKPADNEDKKASTPEPPLPPKAVKVKVEDAEEKPKETTEKDSKKTKLPKSELDAMMDDIDKKING
jgi:hypothetical protein